MHDITLMDLWLPAWPCNSTGLLCLMAGVALHFTSVRLSIPARFLVIMMPLVIGLLGTFYQLNHIIFMLRAPGFFDPEPWDRLLAEISYSTYIGAVFSILLAFVYAVSALSSRFRPAPAHALSPS